MTPAALARDSGRSRMRLYGLTTRHCSGRCEVAADFLHDPECNHQTC